MNDLCVDLSHISITAFITGNGLLIIILFSPSQDNSVKYLNAYGEFIDHHRIKTTTKRGKTQEITAKHVIIATGGRPKYPDIPGKD